MDVPDTPRGDLKSTLADVGRLQALARTGLPDAAARPSFDRLARLAARFLGAPVALVSLVDADRQFFPGCVGLPEPWASRGETPLSHSFCQHVVAAGEPLIIADARLDPRVRENLAIDEIGVVAYLGIPLALDGRVIGSFCAIDGRPRAWTADDVATMVDLAASVVAELRLRAESAEAVRQRAIAEEARRRSDVTLASIGDAVIVTDAAGAVTYLNPVAARLCGWADAEARGRPLDEVFRIVEPGSRRPLETPVAIVRGTGRFAGWWDDTILLARDGSERDIEESAAPIRAADGQVLGAVLAFRDITARRAVVRSLAENEERLRMALDASRMVAFEWTPADGVLRVSANAAAIFGLPAGSSLTRIEQGLRIVHPDDEARYRRAYERAVAELGSYQIQYRVVRPVDGGVVLIEERGHALPAGGGRGVRLVGVACDVTEREAAAEQLRRGEERYRTLFNSIEEGFCVIEVLHDEAGKPVDYRFLEANPAFEGHTGLRDVVGRRMLEMAPDHEPYWFELYGEVARTGRPLQVEQEARAIGDRWFAVNAVRVGDPSQRRVAVLFNDITDRKRAEAEREGLLAELREADRRKDEFLAMLAHELRNPLAAITGAVALARADRAPATVEQVTDLVDRQARQLTRLIDDLLDVSRIATGKVALRPETVELGQLVARAVEQVRPLIEAKGHELAVDGPCAPVLLVADPARAAQVLGNLLTNAAKYTPPGGHIRVEAGVSAAGDEVVVAIFDDGVGIPPAMLPEVFGLFTQVDASLERSQGGLGIGLTLVRSLVEMHGGRVTAASDGEGRGSTFTVALPVGTPDAAARAPARPEAARPARGNRRILIVDDNRDTARMTGRLLAHRGFEVASAFDGVEGVEAARRLRPDVVLLDIGLPGMSGYEVAEAIRRDEAARAAVIVGVSGYGEARAQDRARAAGFDHHLTKPLDFDRLDEILRRLVAPPEAALG